MTTNLTLKTRPLKLITLERFTAVPTPCRWSPFNHLKILSLDVVDNWKRKLTHIVFGQCVNRLWIFKVVHSCSNLTLVSFSMQAIYVLHKKFWGCFWIRVDLINCLCIGEGVTFGGGGRTIYHLEWIIRHVHVDFKMMVNCGDYWHPNGN